MVAEQTGRSRSAVERAIREKKPTEPHASTRALYVRAAAEWAAEQLQALGLEPARHHLGALYCYWREPGSAATVSACECGCGFTLPPGHRKWYSDTHRKRAARSRWA